MPPALRARIEAGRPQFETMARQQYGLEIKAGPFGIDSRAALIGEAYAAAQGLGDAFHDAVAAAYWQQAQPIDDPQVLAELATAVGLSRDAFLAALGQPEYEQAVDADIAWAHANGLTGVPAVVFAERYLVMGAQPYAVFEQVLRQCQSENGE